MKTCDICGRNIKTGRKYCWQHRNFSPINNKGKKVYNYNKGIVIFIIVGFIILWTLLYFFVPFISKFEGSIKFLVPFIFFALFIWGVIELFKSYKKRNEEHFN